MIAPLASTGYLPYSDGVMQSPSFLYEPRRFASAAPKAVRPLFAFDLDGTVTREELLPRIAALAGKRLEMAELTRLTLSGMIPFAESFRLRVAMLAHIPVAEVRACVASVSLDPHIAAFIAARRDDCVIITGNLDIWVAPLLERLGCRFFSSRGVVGEGGVRLLSVLDKADAAETLLKEGRPLVAVGESVGDEPLFERAHYGVAFAGVHAPASGLLRLATHVAEDGRRLCALLCSLERGAMPKRPHREEALPCGG